MSAMFSCPEKQLPLQNYSKPTFVQPTAQGQLMSSIGKGRYDGKVVASGHRGQSRERVWCMKVAMAASWCP